MTIGLTIRAAGSANAGCLEQIIHGRTHRNRDELAAAVTTFVQIYNRKWPIGKLRYKSPTEARLAYQADFF